MVVTDMSRMTRSEGLAERGRIMGAVQDAGAKLVIAGADQVLDLSSSSGDLMASLFAYFAAEENRLRRARSLAGGERAVRAGRKPRGNTPFGYRYDKNTKTVEPHPEQAPVVAEIYRRVAAGETAAAVGIDLEARGAPTPRGQRWHANTARIVRAAYYRGEWTVDAARGLRIAIPPLVDEATWYAAQAVLDRNAIRGLRQTRHVYLCEGLIRCGICGGRVGIQREGAATRGHRSGYYICLNKRGTPPPGAQRCKLPMVQTRFVDERVWAALAELVKRPDLVEMLAAGVGDEEADAWEQDAAAARHQLADLQAAEGALLERFTRGLISAPAMDAQLARIADRRAFLQRQGSQAAAAGQGARSRARAVEDAGRVLAALRESLAAAAPEERRELVRALLPDAGHAIVMRPDKSLEITAVLGSCSGASGSSKGDEPGHVVKPMAFRVVA